MFYKLVRTVQIQLLFIIIAFHYFVYTAVKGKYESCGTGQEILIHFIE